MSHFGLGIDGEVERALDTHSHHFQMVSTVALETHQHSGQHGRKVMLTYHPTIVDFALR